MMTRIKDGGFRELQTGNATSGKDTGLIDENVVSTGGSTNTTAESVDDGFGTFNDTIAKGLALYYKDDSAYNVQTCEKYKDDAFFGERNMRSRFEVWFAEVEEASKCSGICSVAYINP